LQTDCASAFYSLQLCSTVRRGAALLTTNQYDDDDATILSRLRWDTKKLMMFGHFWLQRISGQ